MKLKIDNYHHIEGNYFNGDADRYCLVKVKEKESTYEFTFINTKTGVGRTFFLDRFGEWDSDEKKWFYKFEHRGAYVSADYFSNLKNVFKTFNEFLKS